MAKWNDSKEPFFCQYRNCKEKVMFDIWPHLKEDPGWCFLHETKWLRWFIFHPWGVYKMLGIIYGTMSLLAFCSFYFLGWP